MNAGAGGSTIASKVLSPLPKSPTKLGRPSPPLINRAEVVSTALAIIDEVGIQDFGLERLAAEMNIRAPSLYYHFNGKAEILSEVARLVTIEVRVPRQPPVDRWHDWFVEIAMRFRQSVLRHPNAAPLLVQYFPRRFALTTYERGASLLQRVGVPTDLHAVIFEGLDAIAFGGALIAAVRGADDLYPGLDPDAQPAQAAAAAANRRNDEQMQREALHRFLSSIDAPAVCCAPAR